MVSISEVINNWMEKGKDVVFPAPRGQGHLAEAKPRQASLAEAENREDRVDARYTV